MGPQQAPHRSVNIVVAANHRLFFLEPWKQVRLPRITQAHSCAMPDDGAAADAEAAGDDAGRGPFLDQLGKAPPLLGSIAGRAARQLQLDIVAGREVFADLQRGVTADDLDQPVFVVEMTRRREIYPVAGPAPRQARWRRRSPQPLRSRREAAAGRRTSRLARACYAVPLGSGRRAIGNSTTLPLRRCS